MNTLLHKAYTVSLLMALFGYTKAQKNIVISDSLAANAEQLNMKGVKQGLGGKWKLQFGAYAVTGQMGWQIGRTKANFWGTRSETNAKQRISFIIQNGSSDTATVEAANYTTTKQSHEFAITSNISVGSDQIEQWLQQFTAFITVNGDTTEAWTLAMNGTATSDTATIRHEAYLFNSNRKIVLSPVTSNKNGDDKRMVPAFGYEGTEKDQPVCAIQYYGGGLLGRNRGIVWIEKRLESKMKLIIAAAMTAVYQFSTAMQDQ